ncbi:MAG TPA: heat-inducible transcriptional repressor HrcA [Candidatus Nanopelagicales bacterium]|nr:heat-inducible transcriptional repressor HrcA [Candidatus Nanopelagicales bacterium]
MTEDRRLAVLRAIVEDYVATHEPVGSRSLVERHSLGVSPATIRNDMAALEDEGLIAQPHTSAGRVPTDQGYRVFVDRLSQVKPLSGAERRAIGSFLDGAVDLDDVMQRSVRLLSQLTRQVALIQYPSLTRSTVRHTELVGLTPTRALLVVITDTGRVEQRVVETSVAMDDELVARIRSKVSEAVNGQRLVDVADRVADLTGTFERDERPAVAAVVATLLETVVERHEERVMLAGTANLAAFGEDFNGAVRPVLEALEEQMVLLRLLGETRSGDALTVRIGHENEVEGLTSTSVVTVGYARGDEVVAQLGVLGPTRMDYPGTMASVRAVARYVGRILTEQQ